MSQDEKILEKLTLLFRDIFDDDAIVLTSTTTSDDIPGWDSANHINLIVATEMRFKIRFSSAEVEAMKNVGDFTTLIERKLKSAPLS